MKKILIVCVCAIVAVLSVSAADGACVIPLDSDVYEIMDALFLMSGRSLPSTSRPWSFSEAREILGKIDQSKLDRSGRRLFEKAGEAIEEHSPRWRVDDGFSLGLNLVVSPEIYLHRNTKDFTVDTDWSYNYDDRPVAGNGVLDLGVGDSFYTHSEFSFSISRYQGKDIEYYSPETDYPYGIGAIVPAPASVIGEEEQNPQIVRSCHLYRNAFSTNIPIIVDLSDVDFNFPKRAIVSFGGGEWNLLFGKERLDWGPSNIGNFSIDSHVGCHDVLRLGFHTPKFKWEWTNLFFDTLPWVTEVTDLSVPKQFKVMMSHRLEFNIWSPLTFVLTESIMYKGTAFEMQNFNPAYIYHQLNNRAMYNSLASVEVCATPFKGLGLYFEFGLDNATMAQEGTSQSDASGWLLGADYAVGLGDGFLRGEVEFAQTSPVMYRRDEVDFLMLQRSYTLKSDGTGTPKLYYIGFPYGPDAQVWHLAAAYAVPGVFKAGLRYNNVTKGSIDMFASHNKDNDNNDKANIVGKTPTGTPSHNFELAAYASFDIPDFTKILHISFDASLAYVGKDGKILGRTYDKATDTQFALGMTLRF